MTTGTLGFGARVMGALISSHVRTWSDPLFVSEGQGRTLTGSHMSLKDCYTEHLNRWIFSGSLVMDIRTCSSISYLWPLHSSPIFLVWSKDSCFLWVLDSLPPLCAFCKYQTGILVFTGCGCYLKGEAVGRGRQGQGQLVLQTARWPWSSPQPVLSPLALERDSEQRTSHQGWPASRSVMGWVCVRPCWPCLTPGQKVTSLSVWEDSRHGEEGSLWGRKWPSWLTCLCKAGKGEPLFWSKIWHRKPTFLPSSLKLLKVPRSFLHHY